MEHLFPLFLILFCIIYADKKIIQSLQRKGTYNPSTHKTLLGSIGTLALFPFKRLQKQMVSTTGALPTGTVESFKVLDRTICMNNSGIRTRLTYFTDDINHSWFKKERIDEKGNLIGTTILEPATMTFKQQSSLLI